MRVGRIKAEKITKRYYVLTEEMLGMERTDVFGARITIILTTYD